MKPVLDIKLTPKSKPSDFLRAVCVLQDCVEQAIEEHNIELATAAFRQLGFVRKMVDNLTISRLRYMRKHANQPWQVLFSKYSDVALLQGAVIASSVKLEALLQEKVHEH